MAKDIRLQILSRANKLFRKGQPDSAVLEYQKLLNIHPDDLEVRRITGDLLLKLDREEEAMEHFKRLAEYYLEDKHGKPRAIAVYKRMISVQRDNLPVISKLADLYMDVKLIAEAIPLYRQLAETYKDKNRADKSLEIYKKILAHTPEDILVLGELGRIYLDLEEYDKAYQLFLPVVERKINRKKFDEAATLLRQIITSNHQYIPALVKLAEVFTKSGKKNRVVVLYESLLSIYEEKGMKKELKKVLEGLIQVSDHPAIYIQQLKALTGEDEKKRKEEEQRKAEEDEWVGFQLKQADVSLSMRNFDKAIDILDKSKILFPKSLEIREKLFETYRLSGQVDTALAEGKALLEEYESKGLNERYFNLSGELAKLKPTPETDIDMWKERTGFEINIDDALPGINFDDTSELSKAEVDASLGNGGQGGNGKHVADYLPEIDFFLREGYPAEAERLINELSLRFPGSPELEEREKQLGVLKSGKEAAPPPAKPEVKPEETPEEKPVRMKETTPINIEFDEPSPGDEKRLAAFDLKEVGLPVPIAGVVQASNPLYCTVFVPPAIVSGEDLIVQVFLHHALKAAEALALAKINYEDPGQKVSRSIPPNTPPSSEVMFELKIYGALVRYPVQRKAWLGETESVAFQVKIPPTYKRGDLTGKLVVSQGSVPIGMIVFTVNITTAEVQAAMGHNIPVPLGKVRLFRNAFVSYGSKDLEEVSSRIRAVSGFQLGHFETILNLQPEERWEEKLYKNIDQADLFVLFWSRSAQQSDWVKQELGYVMRRKHGNELGPPELVLVSIDGTNSLPGELRSMHFNDLRLYFRNKG